MQITNIIRSVTIGGLEQQARSLVAGLTWQGVSSRLMVLHSERVEDHIKLWLREAGDCLFVEDRASCSRVLRLAAVFRRDTSVLYHFHYALPDGLIWSELLAAKLAGKKVVVTLHHVLGWSNTSAAHQIKQLLSRALVDRFITTTRAAARTLAQNIENERIRVVPCGVEAAALVSRSDARRRLLSRWTALSEPADEASAPRSSSSEDCFVIACVCRIERYKGVFELAEVVAGIFKEHPTVKLAVVGAGPDYAELKSAWGDHPAIHILGRVDSPDEVLAASDLFAMPSREEGFGLVFAEAAMRGVPSVAPRLPTVSEVVIDGETGWLVSPGNRAQLRDAILEAMTQPGVAIRRGLAALQHVKRFELPRIIRESEAVYREVLR